jgi:hypothetical protein
MAKKNQVKVSYLVENVEEAQTEANYAEQERNEYRMHRTVSTAIRAVDKALYDVQRLVRDAARLAYQLDQWRHDIVNGEQSLGFLPVNSCGQFQSQLPEIERECGEAKAICDMLNDVGGYKDSFRKEMVKNLAKEEVEKRKEQESYAYQAARSIEDKMAMEIVTAQGLTIKNVSWSVG